MTFSTSAVAVCCCSDSAQLVEQPCVLDSDDRLVGKGAHQLDLLFGKWLHKGSADNRLLRPGPRLVKGGHLKQYGSHPAVELDPSYIQGPP